MMHLVENLKIGRKLSGLSQGAFGKLTGYTKDQVYSYESEKATPPLEYKRITAEILGITTYELENHFFEEGEFNGIEVRDRVRRIQEAARIEQPAPSNPDISNDAWKEIKNLISSTQRLSDAQDKFAESSLIQARNIDRLIGLLEKQNEGKIIMAPSGIGKTPLETKIPDHYNDQTS